MKNFINSISFSLLIGLFFMILTAINDVLRKIDTPFYIFLIITMIAFAYSSTRHEK